MDPFLGTALPPLIVVSADDIAERAYAIYEERVRADGHDRERTGFRAEPELAALQTSARRQPPSSSTKRLSTENSIEHRKSSATIDADTFSGREIQTSISAPVWMERRELSVD